MRLAVLALTLAACAPGQTYSGVLATAEGVAAANVPVKLVEADWWPGDPSFDDALVSLPPIAETTTAADGRFALSLGGALCPTCTPPSDYALAFEPAGDDGPILIQHVGAETVDVGPLALPPTLAPAANGAQLDVGNDAPLPDDALVFVDGRAWSASAALPLAALDCPSDASCAHDLFATWKAPGLIARTPHASLSAVAPQPVFSATLDQTTSDSTFAQALPAATIFVDDADATATEIGVRTDASGWYHLVPCASFGGGVRCTAPASQGLSVAGPGTLVRVFADLP